MYKQIYNSETNYFQYIMEYYFLIFKYEKLFNYTQMLYSKVLKIFFYKNKTQSWHNIISVIEQNHTFAVLISTPVYINIHKIEGVFLAMEIWSKH